MKSYQLPQHLIDLAKRFDNRVGLANVIDANGAGHGPDGKFDGSGSGGGGTPKGLTYKDSRGQLNSVEHSYKNQLRTGQAVMARNEPRTEKARILNALIDDYRKERGDFYEGLFGPASDDNKTLIRRQRRAGVKGLHMAAISGGLKYNRATHQYE